jgi:hypothetical protein
MGTGFALALSYREIANGLWRLPHLTQIVAGWHVTLSSADFLAFAMGASGQGIPHGAGFPDLVSRVLLVPPPFWLALAVLGLVARGRAPRSGPFLVVLAVFAGLYAYLRFACLDPWTGELGHSWNLFRWSQWAYPFVLVLQVAGLLRLRALLPVALARASLVAVLALSCALAGMHWGWSRPLGLSMRRVIASDTPLTDLPRLQRRFAELPPGTLLLVGRAANRHLWLGAYASLLAYPRPIVGDWDGSAGVHPGPSAALYRDLLSRVGEPGIVAIVGAVQPFVHVGLVPLGGGFARIETTDRPTLLYVASPVSRMAGGASPSTGFQVGFGRAKVVVLSAKRATVDLSLQGESVVTAEPSRSLDVFAFPDDVTNPVPRGLMERSSPIGEMRMDTAAPEWTVQVPLEAGVTTVVLSTERRAPTTPAPSSFEHAMRSASVGAATPGRTAALRH